MLDIFLIIVLPVLLILLFLLGSYWYCKSTVSSEIIKISDKGIVVHSSTIGDDVHVESHHMVYTTNGQAIKNTNCIWFWKFHSDELQGKFKKGKRYKIKTYGVRIPWLGLYKHIISATEIKTTKRKVIKK